MRNGIIEFTTANMSGSLIHNHTVGKGFVITLSTYRNCTQAWIIVFLIYNIDVVPVSVSKERASKLVCTIGINSSTIYVLSISYTNDKTF